MPPVPVKATKPPLPVTRRLWDRERGITFLDGEEERAVPTLDEARKHARQNGHRGIVVTFGDVGAEPSDTRPTVIHRDTAPPFSSATPADRKKYDEYVATVRAAGIEPRSLNVWLAQYRKNRAAQPPHS